MPSQSTRWSGFSALITLALIVLAGAGMVWGVALNVPHTRISKPVKRTSTPPSVAGFMPALGLDADSLAASGVSATAATTVATDLRAYLANHWEEMLAARTGLDSARTAHGDLVAKLQAGTPPAEGAEAAAASALSSAESAWQASVAGAKAAAVDSLSTEQKNALATLAANAGHHVPAAYRIVTRTPADWIVLQDALKTQNYLQQRGESVPAGIDTVMSGADADSAVIQAQTNIAANRTAIREAIAAVSQAH
jgi:hypothetical protein